MEALYGAPLILVITSAIFLIVSHLWTHSYLNIEAFYLARARMYQNTTSCHPNLHLLPNSWVERTLYCHGSHVQSSYTFLPGIITDSEQRRSIQGTFSVELLRN